MTMVPSVIGKCCEVKARGLYKAGEIIEVSDVGSCSRKTVKCGRYGRVIKISIITTSFRADAS